jgi:hypothetical protein
MNNSKKVCFKQLALFIIKFDYWTALQPGFTPIHPSIHPPDKTSAVVNQ